MNNFDLFTNLYEYDPLSPTFVVHKDHRYGVYKGRKAGVKAGGKFYLRTKLYGGVKTMYIKNFVWQLHNGPV
ncbi:MAG: hypothetical protein ACRCSY_04045, partial [Cetobacterium sp.]